MCRAPVAALIGLVACGLLSGPGPLRAAGPPGPSARVARLIERLGSARFEERQAAERELGKVGVGALGALRAAAGKDEDLERRRRARRLVVRIENSPEGLLADYRRWGLPLPPKGARLVRVEQVGQKAFFSLHFLLRPGTRHTLPRFFDVSKRADERRADQWRITPLDPARANAKDIAARVSTPGPPIEVVVQCHARGWDALARGLLDKNCRRHPDRTPHEQLADVAWSYWWGKLFEPDSDWKRLAPRLRLLLAAEQHLRTPHNLALLKSLEAALVPSKARPGSIEALIDRLINARLDCYIIKDEVKPDDPLYPYTRLVELGFTAVPALLKHRDDDRLTRSTLCVGYVVREILEKLGAEEEDLHGWWARAKKQGEEAYPLAHVLPPEDVGREWANDHMLLILARKYPHRLPRLYETVLRKRPELISWPVTRAIACSRLPRAQKVKLLVEGAKHPDPQHALYALVDLKDLDARQFVPSLIHALGSLPRTPAGYYWLCPERYVGGLVLGTDDPRAWKTLNNAARRSDVGLRMEFLAEVGEAEAKTYRSQRVAFLAAFLEDPTVRDTRSDPKRFDGFCAGHDFPRLEVRNFAAMRLAALLKVRAEPRPDWTAKEWADFRAKVREALKGGRASG